MVGEFWQDIAALLVNWLNFDKQALKSLFIDYHLEWLWSSIRDYLLNINIWVYGVFPALILQYFWPADKSQKLLSHHFFFDALYPIFFNFVSIALITGFVVDFYFHYLPFLNTGLLDDKPFWMQAIGAFLILDLMSYVGHRIMHENKYLWQFHFIHHTAIELNPMTFYRGHPAENVIRAVIRTVPVAFIGGETSNWIIYFLINNFWDHYTHANTRVNFGWIKYILVTPQYHRIHHSSDPKHYNKNYANKLVLWDWLFGSMHRNFTEYPAIGMEEGRWVVESSGSPVEFLRAFASQFIYPFVQIYKMATRQRIADSSDPS